VINVGIDSAEAHHDVCILDESGRILARARVCDGVEGIEKLHEMIGEHAGEPEEVTIGLETDRGLLVAALVASRYDVRAVNPVSVSRYRDRLAVGGSKSDAGEARVLAEAMRTDRHLHRAIAGDTELAEAIKVLARAHQNLVWTRQRVRNQLRSVLREFYPGALRALPDLGSGDTVAILTVAPTPTAGRALTHAKTRRALAKAGRTRRLDERAREIHDAMHAPQLGAPLASSFETHPDAEIITSLPGLSFVLGARVLGEFGDDPTRYTDAKARRCYAGSAPITRASGTRKVVLARVARNRRLADACYGWAFSSLSSSRGARAFYDRQRAAGKTHHQALRALANRWVGILHGCLKHREPYSEEVAWPADLAAVA